jgi:hypothetical protein
MRERQYVPSASIAPYRHAVPQTGLAWLLYASINRAVNRGSVRQDRIALYRIQRQGEEGDYAPPDISGTTDITR